MFCTCTHSFTRTNDAKIVPSMDAQCDTKDPFRRVGTKFCTDKNLQGSNLRLDEAGGTGRMFLWLRVQVWDLHFSGPV